MESFENVLDELINEDKICVSKKGSYVYCWDKECFLNYLINSDLKFKYLYKSISSVQDKINNYSDSIFKYIENVDCELIHIKNSLKDIENKINDLKTHESKTEDIKSDVSLDVFKENFDGVLQAKSSSIGWVELSSIKDEICHMCDISDNEFYSYVSDITELYPDRYELSSGGYEGIILRGIVHGFVRCI
jgi:archaellum component FlaC